MAARLKKRRLRDLPLRSLLDRGEALRVLQACGVAEVRGDAAAAAEGEVGGWRGGDKAVRLLRALWKAVRKGDREEMARWVQAGRQEGEPLEEREEDGEDVVMEVRMLPLRVREMLTREHGFVLHTTRLVQTDRTSGATSLASSNASSTNTSNFAQGAADAVERKDDGKASPGVVDSSDHDADADDDDETTQAETKTREEENDDDVEDYFSSRAADGVQPQDEQNQRQHQGQSQRRRDADTKDVEKCFDGKLIVRLQDGHLVETVIIKYMTHREGEEKPRPGHVTVCVSSQVGCKMGCTFCETGTMGLSGNLTAGEILEQVWHANRLVSRAGFAVRNVVFMGMGEPMDNYENVLQAIHGMHELFGLAYSRISVSTVGVVSRIRQLAVDCPEVNLALSLHAPTQESRLPIVPSARAFSVDALMSAVDEFTSRSKSDLMIEYIMIGGVNTSETLAHQLGELLRSRRCWLNLIPYNPTAAGDMHNFVSPTEDELVTFRDIVMSYTNARGEPISARIRWSTTRAREVNGACGQLALKNLDNNLRATPKAAAAAAEAAATGTATVHDIEDLGTDGVGGVGGAQQLSNRGSRSSRAEVRRNKTRTAETTNGTSAPAAAEGDAQVKDRLAAKTEDIEKEKAMQDKSLVELAEDLVSLSTKESHLPPPQQISQTMTYIAVMAGVGLALLGMLMVLVATGQVILPMGDAGEGEPLTARGALDFLLQSIVQGLNNLRALIGVR